MVSHMASTYCNKWFGSTESDAPSIIKLNEKDLAKKRETQTQVILLFIPMAIKVNS